MMTGTVTVMATVTVTVMVTVTVTVTVRSRVVPAAARRGPGCLPASLSCSAADGGEGGGQALVRL